MRLLLLAPFPYGSSSGQGGATVCLKALKSLAENHEVTVLCFSTGTSSDKVALREMATYTENVLSVPLSINKWTIAKAKLRSIFGTTPEHAIYFESNAFRASLATTLAAVKPDVVITQFPQMAQYLAQCSGTATVHDVQDAFSVSWFRRYQTTANGLKRWYAFKQWNNWLQYEAKHYSKASQCWTLSEQDRYGLTVFNPQLNVSNMGLPLTDEVRTLASISRGKVGFIASFGHPPNRESLQFLLRDIAPRVYARMPEVEFSIAGREPPEALVRLAPSNCKFLGYVDSLQGFYDSCSVIVAPLLSGGGVKIKVAEALCYGKPVVTTPVGAEGIPISPGIHAFVEVDADRLAGAICTLMASEIDRTRMSSAATHLANTAFSRSAWAERANQQLDLLMCSIKATTLHAEQQQI